MLPSWYPSLPNPHNGSFFREQALALSVNFNFIVVRPIITKQLDFVYKIKQLLGYNKPLLEFIQDDEGILEFSFRFTIPTPSILWKIIHKMTTRLLSKSCTNRTSTSANRCTRIRLGKQPTTKIARYYAIEYLKKKQSLPHFDIVYSLTTQDMVSLGNDFAEIYTVPHITAEHAPFPWPGKVLDDYTVKSIEKANAFLAISHDKIRQVLLQNIKTGPIYWVGNLVDDTKFTISMEKHSTPTFLIVAAYSFYKNYPLFVKSMEELKRIATKPFNIIIAGYNANPGYSQNTHELEKLVRESTISENTTMIGAVSREEIPQLYNSADVFVLTSIQEGMPVCALEASVSGLPIISTRCGGIEDYLDESMGRIFPITDYVGIAQACNMYLEGELKFAPPLYEKKLSVYSERKVS